ncbi:MAG: hypothetical protein ACRCX2_33715 [Paraclostridium sp.]
MIIPVNVKVGNFVYGVDETDEIITFEGLVAQGLCDSGNQQIKIDNKLTQQSKERVFLHELVHAICFDKELDFEGETEYVVDALAKGLHGVIIDNPNLFCNCFELEFEDEVKG